MEVQMYVKGTCVLKGADTDNTCLIMTLEYQGVSGTIRKPLVRVFHHEERASVVQTLFKALSELADVFPLPVTISPRTWHWWPFKDDVWLMNILIVYVPRIYPSAASSHIWGEAQEKGSLQALFQACLNGMNKILAKVDSKPR